MAKKPNTLPATQETAPAPALTEGADFFSQHSGAGLENVTANDMLVPRLTILQALSPQLKARDPAYIPGAQVGHICDVGMGEIFPEGILFLPVYYRKDYLEWAPRSSGGGLVNVHTDPAIMDQTTRNDRNQPLLPNGNLIAETAQFFGFNLSAPSPRACFIPMASTQLKKARKWITLANAEKLKKSDGSDYTAPLFYRAYELGTADESNAQGDWTGWTIARGPALPELDLGRNWQSIAQDAVLLRDAIAKGERKADVSELGAEATGGSDGEAM